MDLMRGRLRVASGETVDGSYTPIRLVRLLLTLIMTMSMTVLLPVGRNVPAPVQRLELNDGEREIRRGASHRDWELVDMCLQHPQRIQGVV